MKKLSIQSVKRLSKLDMKQITAGSCPVGGGGPGGGGGGSNDCNKTCLSGFSGFCVNVCTFCFVPAGQTSGLCQA